MNGCEQTTPDSLSFVPPSTRFLDSDLDLHLLLLLLSLSPLSLRFLRSVSNPLNFQQFPLHFFDYSSLSPVFLPPPPSEQRAVKSRPYSNTSEQPVSDFASAAFCKPHAGSLRLSARRKTPRDVLNLRVHGGFLANGFDATLLRNSEILHFPMSLVR